MKRVFKCATEGDERRSWSVKRSSLGMPPCTPKKYPRRLKRLSLGMPPCIPFFINNYQFVLRFTIFLSLHALCAMLGASCSLLFNFLQLFLLFITSQNPSFFLWERNTLHFILEHIIGFSCLSFAMFVLYVFVAIVLPSSCVIMFIYFQEFLISLWLELSLVFMFSLFKRVCLLH